MLRQLPYSLARRLGVAALARRAAAAPIFCFHDVCDDTDAGRRGDTSLHVGATAFAAYLDLIATLYRVVPLPDLAARLAAGQPVRGLAALTFDDACEGVFRHAVPALRARGLPWTVFVIGGAGASPAPFWWDVLAERGALTDAQREHCLTTLAGRRDAILDAGGTEPSVPDAFLPASWERLRAALGPDLTLGAHTMSHCNLAAIPPDEAAREIADSADTIAARLGTRPTVVSYPYGRYTPATLAAARAGGCPVGVTMRFGRARAGDDILALPRVNVPAGLATDTLVCWAAGLRPRPPV